MNKVTYTIRAANWEQDKELLRKIRTEVFIIEQQVPIEEEWDEQDEQSTHVIALDSENNPIATGRLTPDAKIGRMAVLKPWRGTGVGSEILNQLIQLAKKRLFPMIALHAQLHAEAFYAKHGFISEGDIFYEANIPHKLMKKNL